MPTTKAGQKAVHKYVKNNYDRLEITVPKGKKEKIKQYAADKGKSLNSFVNEAIDDKMDKNK
ncbi:MAG: hypothetical protein Q8873_01785 [Bacillota bacterium]|nr:hypothetical protein [Bacillota bacterium]